MREDFLDGLIDALRAHRRAAVGAVHLPESGGEHAEVVVHLGQRADRGAGRAAGAPLLDRHRRGEPLDLVKQRLGYLPYELPRIRRETLDIPPLPLGVERVEGQRCLAAAARTAADGELPAGDVGVDVLEVVECRAADGDVWRPGIAGGLADRVEHRRHGRRRVDDLLSADGGFALGLGRRLRGREQGRQRDARVGALRLGDLLGRALRHDPAAAGAPLGPQVDHPVGPLHDVEVVLHHEHRVARLDEPLQHHKQLPHVGHVEARRRLIEDVERLSGGSLGELPRQLHPLGLATGERRRGLAEVEIIEPHVVERLELAGDVGGIAKEFERVADLHLQ